MDWTEIEIKQTKPDVTGKSFARQVKLDFKGCRNKIAS